MGPGNLLHLPHARLLVAGEEERPRRKQGGIAVAGLDLVGGLRQRPRFAQALVPRDEQGGQAEQAVRVVLVEGQGFAVLGFRVIQALGHLEGDGILVVSLGVLRLAADRFATEGEGLVDLAEPLVDQGEVQARSVHVAVEGHGLLEEGDGILQLPLGHDQLALLLPRHGVVGVDGQGLVDPGEAALGVLEFEAADAKAREDLVVLGIALQRLGIERVGVIELLGGEGILGLLDQSLGLGGAHLTASG